MPPEQSITGKKKGRFSKGILVGILVFLFVFTCVCLFITYKTSVEPSTLIMSVFGFCSIEGGVLGAIKVSKLRKRKDDIEC